LTREIELRQTEGMIEDPPTRRRWLRFSLRTLLVLVTLLCLYLGWAMNWIRQRQAFLRDSVPDDPIVKVLATVSGLKEQAAPWSLRLLNENGIPWLYFESAEQQKLIEVSQLFPEAKVYFLEVTNRGTRSRAMVLFDNFPPFDMIPYYQNGVLFQDDILTQVAYP
jgi:hypothetical protein